MAQTFHFDADRLMGGALLLFAFALPLSRALDTFFVILFILYFLYRLFRRDTTIRTLFKEPLAWLIVAFVGYLTLSLAWSPDITNGLKYLRQYYWEWPALFGVTLYVIDHPDKARQAVTAFVGGMLISELLSYGMFFGLWQIRGHGPEYPSPFMMHIDYSVYLAVTAMILLNRLFSDRYSTKEKWLMLFFFLTITGNLFINKGRTGQVAFLTAMFVAFFLHYRLTLKNLLKISFLAAMLFGTAYALVPPFQERVHQAVEDLRKLDRSDFHSSLGLRAAQYIVAKELVADHPLLGSGVGGRNAEVAAQLKKESYGFSPFVQEFLATHHAHSQYLQTLIEGGAVAFLIMLAMLWRLGRLKLDDSELHELKTLFLTVFVVGFLTEPLWQKQFSNTLFILMTGLFVGHRLAQRSRP